MFDSLGEKSIYYRQHDLPDYAVISSFLKFPIRL